MNEKHEIITTSILASVEDIFTAKRINGVLSHDTAAVAWGFCNKLVKKIDITFPKSTISKDIKSRKQHFNTYQQIVEKYNKGIEYIEWEGKNIRIYSPERTIVEIIKNKGKNLNDVDIETIKTFFTEFKYDNHELEYFTKMFNVEFEVNFAKRFVNA